MEGRELAITLLQAKEGVEELKDVAAEDVPEVEGKEENKVAEED